MVARGSKLFKNHFKNLSRIVELEKEIFEKHLEL